MLSIFSFSRHDSRRSDDKPASHDSRRSDDKSTSDISRYSHDKSSITSLAIGCFDALHLGHFALIDALDDDGALLIIDKHAPRQIVPNHLKEQIAKKRVFFVDFDAIKSLSAKEFLDFVMGEFGALEYFVAGYDFCFGRGKECDASALQRLSGIRSRIICEYKIDGISIHSSTIKALLDSGDISTASRYLGRTYAISAPIIRGQGLGKREFVPTINLDANEFYLPRAGVYLTRTLVDGDLLDSVSFVGTRSTDGALACETHILGRDITVQSTHASVYFLRFLRPSMHFDSFDRLRAQIDADIMSAMSQKDDYEIKY